MNIKINIKNFFIIFIMLLPLQDTLRIVLHLPSYFLLIYVFLFFAFAYMFTTAKKFFNFSKLEILLITIFLLYIIEMIISGIVNFPSVDGRHLQLPYYLKRYKPFWDEPLMSFLFAGIIKPFVYFSFSIFLIKYLNAENKIRFLLQMLVYLAFASSVYAIYQFIGYHLGLPFTSICSGHAGEIITTMNSRRCEGFFYEPGPHAAYLSIIFTFCVFQFKNKINPLFHKIKLAIFSIVILIGMFLTLSPIGLLTPILILIIKFVQLFHRIKSKKKIAILMCSTLMIIFFFCMCNTLKFGTYQKSLNEYIYDRVYNSFINHDILTGDSRAMRNLFGVLLLKDHLILGVGPGNDGYFYSEYMPFTEGLIGDKAIVINNNIKILVDSGVVGAIFYIIILAVPFWVRKKYNHLVKINPFLNSVSTSGLYSIIVFVLISFNANAYLFYPIFWIVYSVTIATCIISNNVLRGKCINVSK